jgi:hypothetical protein
MWYAAGADVIARLTVAIPFALAVPEGASYIGYSYEEDGITIVARPPVRSDQVLTMSEPLSIELDGQNGFVANALQFDFHKLDFDRHRNAPTYDPTLELMERVVRGFLSRLRYATRAAQVHQIDLGRGVTWRLEYLADDGSALAEDSEKFRVRAAKSVSVSLVGLSPSVWDVVHQLDSDWLSPVWDDILLDASSVLPNVGTSVVLAATALEVFVADVLERMASGGDVPANLWGWLNARDSSMKDPSTEEQFDVLLKHFTGHSLKEEVQLWQAFKDIRTARNKFVHEGVARIGGQPVSADKASQLVSAAHDIIKAVRKWLPADKQWPQPEAKVSMSFVLPMIGGASVPKAT